MFKIIRFPKNLESFFDSLQNSFHWGHFEYFRALILLIVIAWGRRNVASLYRHLDSRNQSHRSRFNNFINLLRWPAQQVLQLKAWDLVQMQRPKPSDTLLLILDDSKKQCYRNLISGFYGVYRNKYAHHDVKPSLSEVKAILEMVNNIIDEIERISLESAK